MLHGERTPVEDPGQQETEHKVNRELLRKNDGRVNTRSNRTLQPDVVHLTIHRPSISCRSIRGPSRSNTEGLFHRIPTPAFLEFSCRLVFQ